MGKIKTLTLIYRGYISDVEVPYLRGSLIKLIGRDTDVLLHNHEGDNYRYSYPLVQYKLISGKAAVVFVNEGITLADTLLSQEELHLRIGNRNGHFVLDNVIPSTLELDAAPEGTLYRYRVTGWVPFNEENFSVYLKKDLLVDRVSFLERILVTNIIAIANGTGSYIEEQIECGITDIDKSYTIQYKGTKLKAFDLEFFSNVLLPQYVSLGKHSSVGFGTLEYAQENGRRNPSFI